jgi:hypothetical protein
VLSAYFRGVVRLATGTDCVNNADEFSRHMPDGHTVMFVHLVFVAVIDFSKAGHGGSLIESGSQGGTATFTHFDFAAPLATLAHPGSMPA